MDFNSIIFPAPTDDKYEELNRHKDKILFIPKKLKNGKPFHIPCLFQRCELNEKPTNKFFLYFHGNAEDIFNANSNLSYIKQKLPFNIISIEYPGYSVYYQDKNAETTEEDSLIVYDFLVNECKIDPKNIVLCGRSIGTGVATYLASKRKPGALILISPIKSIQDTAKTILGFMKFIISNRYNNYERIKDVTCPLLIIHGQKDSLIPFEDSIQLAERTSGPYELILPETMNHNEVIIYDDFFLPISGFLKRHNLCDMNDSEYFLSERYFITPAYLKEGNWSNKDRTSMFIRKILKI
jgi:esterase/lipase